MRRWGHYSSPAAAFSRNRLPDLMYFRTICTDLCPVWFMMALSLLPALAAAVASPKR